MTISFLNPIKKTLSTNIIWNVNQYVSIIKILQVNFSL